MSADLEHAVLDLSSDLIRRRSITPEDAGCQDLIAARLLAQGFELHRVDFGQTRNLWAVHGRGGPLFALVGHTDVVPPGPLERWSSDPFVPEVRDGRLYGRGAADMKSAVAAMCVALEGFVRDRPAHPGRVALLLTSDEEGSAADGIKRVVPWLLERGDRIDWCLIGEPSSSACLGDRIRIGRRGSLHAYITVHGIQGHVAYPEHALNPVLAAGPLLSALAAETWDQGNAHFPPTSFQIYEAKAGTGANNVIPGEFQLNGNFRFGTASTAESLEVALRRVLERSGVRYDLRMRLSSAPFLTTATTLIEAVCAATAAVLGRSPVSDTGGGTSDGRFIAAMGSEIVELGPVNASIHKVDEHVAVADLAPLAQIYRGVLERLLGAGAGASMMAGSGLSAHCRAHPIQSD